MRERYILVVFAVVFGVAMQCVAATPTRLSCEYCDNPVGVEAAKPRLSWWLPEGAGMRGTNGNLGRNMTNKVFRKLLN